VDRAGNTCVQRCTGNSCFTTISQATAIVSGTLALIWSKRGNVPGIQIETELYQSNTVDVISMGKDEATINSLVYNGALEL
jgi:hypothetical protein